MGDTAVDYGTAAATIDLPLDRDEEHPRRLLAVGRHVLAYGGDDGTVALLERQADRDDDDDKGAVTTRARAARRFDEDTVRAVAVSDDGRRIVVGSDAGTTQVFAYDGASFRTDDLHPFLGAGAAGTSATTEGSQDDPFLSQSEVPRAPAVRGEQVFPGPSFEAPVRDVLFLPKTYIAVIATETGLAAVDVTSKSTVRAGAIQELTEAFESTALGDGAGVRGLAVATFHSGHGDCYEYILSALDMEGCLTHFFIAMEGNAAGVGAAAALRVEGRKAVPQRDVGEMLGAAPACRATRPRCLPTLLRSSASGEDGPVVLAVGGQPYLQLRVFQSGRDGKEVHEHDQSLVAGADGIQGHLDAIVTTAALGDSGFVVSGGRDKRLVLWRLAARGPDGALRADFVRRLGGECSAVPTDLLWHADAATGMEYLYVATADGRLTTFDYLLEDLPESTEPQTTATLDSGKENAAAADDSGDDERKTYYNERNTEEEPIAPSPKTTVDKSQDSDGDDEDALESPRKSHDTRHDAGAAKNPFIDDEAEDDDEEDDYDDVSLPGTRTKPTDSPGANADDRSTADDDSASLDDDYDRDQYLAVRPRETFQPPAPKLPDPQPAFAPSSTPLGMARRFMCWNHIGAVTHIQGVPGVSRSSVDIDFTDSLSRRKVNFTDNIGFILGSLGEDGAIFATDLSEDDDEEDGNFDAVIEGLHMSEATKAALKKSQQKRMARNGSKATGSTIFFHRFETFAAVRDKDWYLTLPDGERALGCACGQGWAAVMTSRRFLRLYTSGGNQGKVLWLPGEPVSMTGRGRFLAVFYHEAPPLMDETQKIGFMLYDAVANRTISSGPASCISAGSCLSWIGFTNESSLVAMDSDGMLSMLASSGADEGVEHMSWDWVPVLDTVGLRKSLDDGFWPVTVYDGKLVCVPLKGGTKHPDATRRPVTTTLGLRLPLARGTLSAVNALEELSVRADIAFHQKKVVNALVGMDDAESESEMLVISAQLDKVTLKMFAAVVEAGKLERALDLVERLHLEKSYDLAIKLANQHYKLADLIEEAKERRFGGDDDAAAAADDDGPADGYFDEDGDGSLPDGTAPLAPDSQRITPDAASGRRTKRAFDDIPAGDLRSADRRVRTKSVFA